MKFSASQLEFLMTKLSTEDIEEALAFKPLKKLVALEDKCFKLKRDGSQCSRRAKDNGLCSAHSATPQTIGDDMRCMALKKNGTNCGTKKMVGDLCKRHSKVVVRNISEEVIVDSCNE